MLMRSICAECFCARVCSVTACSSRECPKSCLMLPTRSCNAACCSHCPSCCRTRAASVSTEPATSFSRSFTLLSYSTFISSHWACLPTDSSRSFSTYTTLSNNAVYCSEHPPVHSPAYLAFSQIGRNAHPNMPETSLYVPNAPRSPFAAWPAWYAFSPTGHACSHYPAGVSRNTPCVLSTRHCADSARRLRPISSWHFPLAISCFTWAKKPSLP